MTHNWAYSFIFIVIKLPVINHRQDAMPITLILHIDKLGMACVDTLVFNVPSFSLIR